MLNRALNRYPKSFLFVVFKVDFEAVLDVDLELYFG